MYTNNYNNYLHFLLYSVCTNIRFIHVYPICQYVTGLTHMVVTYTSSHAKVQQYSHPRFVQQHEPRRDRGGLGKGCLGAWFILYWVLEITLIMPPMNIDEYWWILMNIDKWIIGLLGFGHGLFFIGGIDEYLMNIDHILMLGDWNPLLLFCIDGYPRLGWSSHVVRKAKLGPVPALCYQRKTEKEGIT